MFGAVAASALFEAADGKCRPTRLVIGADPTATVSVEVFVEEHELAEMRIVLVALGITVQGATPIFVGEEDCS